MSEAEKRSFAVFDIDGTLIRWQLYHAIGDGLAKAGLIQADSFAKVREARMVWKRREHETSFHEYELEIIKAYDAAITDISVNDWQRVANQVFDEYKDQTYTYTRDLIRTLKAQNYLLFAISASQHEIVEMLAKYYGFDDWGGSEYKSTSGQYNGEKYVLKGEEKPKYLRSLIAKHNASTEGSIGIGDSDGDIIMLNEVEQPIAFNPNKALFDHAQTHGWKIVVERKNVAYELESDNGTYKLVA